MDIQEIKKEYFSGTRYKQLMPTKMKYAEDYVVDENLTVKENRERVHKLNEAYRNEAEQVRKENIDKLTLFAEDMVEYIVNEYHFTEAQARAIEQEVYSEYNDCMYDYFGGVDKVCSFVREILDMI